MTLATGGAAIPGQPTEKCHNPQCACPVERKAGMRGERCQCGHPACRNQEQP